MFSQPTGIGLSTSSSCLLNNTLGQQQQYPDDVPAAYQYQHATNRRLYNGHNDAHKNKHTNNKNLDNGQQMLINDCSQLLLNGTTNEQTNNNNNNNKEQKLTRLMHSPAISAASGSNSSPVSPSSVASSTSLNLCQASPITNQLNLHNNNLSQLAHKQTTSQIGDDQQHINNSKLLATTMQDVPRCRSPNADFVAATLQSADRYRLFSAAAAAAAIQQQINNNNNNNSAPNNRLRRGQSSLEDSKQATQLAGLNGGDSGKKQNRTTNHTVNEVTARHQQQTNLIQTTNSNRQQQHEQLLHRLGQHSASTVMCPTTNNDQSNTPFARHLSGLSFMPTSTFPWATATRGKPRRGMMRRAVFSDNQRTGLERRFQLQKYISKPDRKKLAEKLGLKDSQVSI